jgi:hypothetical protein
MSRELLCIEVDCHGYPWHEPREGSEEYGPDTLIRFAETYGVIVQFLAEHNWHGWAWWYTITGYRENIERFLIAEYSDDEVLMKEWIDDIIRSTK